jgi:hypothetical protein
MKNFADSAQNRKFRVDKNSENNVNHQIGFNKRCSEDFATISLVLAWMLSFRSD